MKPLFNAVELLNLSFSFWLNEAKNNFFTFLLPVSEKFKRAKKESFTESRSLNVINLLSEGVKGREINAWNSDTNTSICNRYMNTINDFKGHLHLLLLRFVFHSEINRHRFSIYARVQFGGLIRKFSDFECVVRRWTSRETLIRWKWSPFIHWSRVRRRVPPAASIQSDPRTITAGFDYCEA